MTVLGLVVLGLVMGLVFGLALEKSRVFEPAALVGQFQFRRFVMLKVFLSAVATGLVVVSAMQLLGVAEIHPKATHWAANAVGGLLLGVGIAVAGACPGTVLAQIGAGYRDAWAVLAGALAGTLAYGYVQPSLKPLFFGDGPGSVVLSDALGVPFWAMALVLAAACVAGLVALERWRPWRQELGADYDLLPPEARPSMRAAHGPRGEGYGGGHHPA